MPRVLPVQLDWKPDRNRSVPVYQQIVRFVCTKVSRGEWPIGTRLPAQRALAEQLGVNRSTVATAIDELTARGLLQSRHGAGTQVASNTWSLLLPAAPDWSAYVASGFFEANRATVQAINRLEFEPDMLRLGTGELDPRLFPTAMWKKALDKVGERVCSLGYLEPLGLLELRNELSAYMETLGVRAPASCILITSGALQALQLISVCLLKSGSTVYTEAPSYLQSLRVFQSAGMRLSGVPMDEAGLQFWKLAPSLQSAAGKRSSILYTIPTNQNPTGITMPNGRRTDLTAFCLANRLPAIEDGAYHELCYEGAPPNLLKSLDKSGAVIYLGSASKTLAPGLRIGWIVAAEPIVQRLGDVKMQMDYGASSVSQWIFAEFLARGFYSGAYLPQLRTALRQRRDAAAAILEKYFKGLATWRVPAGGFYIWLTLRKAISLDKLFQQAVRAKILLNPGDLYDFSGNNSLRMSYAYTTPAEFERAAKTLAAMLEAI